MINNTTKIKKLLLKNEKLENLHWVATQQQICIGDSVMFTVPKLMLHPPSHNGMLYIYFFVKFILEKSFKE